MANSPSLHPRRSVDTRPTPNITGQPWQWRPLIPPCRQSRSHRQVCDLFSSRHHGESRPDRNRQVSLWRGHVTICPARGGERVISCRFTYLHHFVGRSQGQSVPAGDLQVKRYGIDCKVVGYRWQLASDMHLRPPIEIQLAGAVNVAMENKISSLGRPARPQVLAATGATNQ